MSLYGEEIRIETVTGGFILSYPVKVKNAKGEDDTDTKREVYVSPRKLQQRLKEVIGDLSFVGQDE